MGTGKVLQGLSVNIPCRPADEVTLLQQRLLQLRFSDSSPVRAQRQPGKHLCFQTPGRWSGFSSCSFSFS